MFKKHLFAILFISWMMLITLFSLFSFSGNISVGFEMPHLDKLAHFIFHFLMVILGVCAVKEVRKKEFDLKKTLIRFFTFSMVYGILIEALQYAMPFGRSAEIYDLIANLLGALIGILLIKKYISLITKLKSLI